MRVFLKFAQVTHRNQCANLMFVLKRFSFVKKWRKRITFRNPIFVVKLQTFLRIYHDAFESAFARLEKDLRASVC